MSEVQFSSEQLFVDRGSLGRHGTQIGIAAPLGAELLAIEVATRVLMAELRRRLPTLTLQLYAPDSSVRWQRWPETSPVEVLTAETPSFVDALVVLGGPTDGGPAGVRLNEVLDQGAAADRGDALIRLPLESPTEGIDIDILALLDLARRILPDVDEVRVVDGLQSCGMWPSGDAVLVDIRGDERPVWWWSAVEARAAALGANVLTSTLDSGPGSVVVDSYPHLPSDVGPETMMVAIANASAVVTDDHLVAALARALGTPSATAQGSGSGEVNRALVDDLARKVGVTPERLSAIDLALDKVAEVAGATASLRSPVSFNQATARLTRRVLALETAHERIVARMVTERRSAAETVAALTAQVHDSTLAANQAGVLNSELVRVLSLTQKELRQIQLLEPREPAGEPRFQWRRWKILRGLRRVLPGPVASGTRRVVRRLRRGR